SPSATHTLSLHDALPISAAARVTDLRAREQELAELASEAATLPQCEQQLQQAVDTEQTAVDRYQAARGHRQDLRERRLAGVAARSEEHTSEFQSRFDLVC